MVFPAAPGDADIGISIKIANPILLILPFRQADKLSAVVAHPDASPVLFVDHFI
jgi:hypothetical protein